MFTLDERLLAAGLEMVADGEYVCCTVTMAGRTRNCFLMGTWEPETTDVLVMLRDSRVCNDRPVPLERVTVDGYTRMRLQKKAAQMDKTPAEKAEEVARAEAWGAEMALRKQLRGTGRNVLGQYNDSLHRCEPAGRR